MTVSEDLDDITFSSNLCSSHAAWFLLCCSSLHYLSHCPLWHNYVINYVLALCYSTPFISIQRKCNGNGGKCNQLRIVCRVKATTVNTDHIRWLISVLDIGWIGEHWQFLLPCLFLLELSNMPNSSLLVTFKSAFFAGAKLHTFIVKLSPSQKKHSKSISIRQ